MTPADFLTRVTHLFAERGHAEYHGEPVSQLEHALQTAALAEAEGATGSQIAAALLHDIGHLLQPHGDHPAEHGIDDRHEALGYRFLLQHLGPAVADPVRLHVPAKRYLCGTEPEYLHTLSPASVLSLRLQGGPMTPTEAVAFEAEPFWRQAVALRRWDDRAKVTDLRTPPFEYFLPYLEAVGGTATA